MTVFAKKNESVFPAHYSNLAQLNLIMINNDVRLVTNVCFLVRVITFPLALVCKAVHLYSLHFPPQ